MGQIMTYNHSKTRAALTRAINSKDPLKVYRACVAAVEQWETLLDHRWPDDWSRWQRALDDAGFHTSLDDL
jgi:hypothetical protein